MTLDLRAVYFAFSHSTKEYLAHAQIVITIVWFFKENFVGRKCHVAS